jgi:hypothetical protein
VTLSENFKARNGDKNYISSKILPNNYREKSYESSFFLWLFFVGRGVIGECDNWMQCANPSGHWYQADLIKTDFPSAIHSAGFIFSVYFQNQMNTIVIFISRTKKQ